jgi:hypothetical protein
MGEAQTRAFIARLQAIMKRAERSYEVWREAQYEADWTPSILEVYCAGYLYGALSTEVSTDERED